MIDVHTHIGSAGGYASDINTLLCCMRGAGIEKAIVSNMTAQADPRQNAETVRLCRKNPALYALYFISPANDPDAQYARAFIQANRDMIVGIKAHPLLDGVSIDSGAYDPFFDVARSFGLPVCFHTQKNGLCDTRMLAQKAPDWPDVAFIAYHMDMLSDHEEAIACVARVKNLYGDCAIMDADAAARAILTCGEEKILFGSDAAVFGKESYARYTRHFSLFNRAFFSDNAKKLFTMEDRV